MTLPTLTVLLDDGTATFPLNVSSKVMAVDGYSVSRGRSDWQGAVTAGELSITFNNSDGFFTVGAGAVFVDQKIKLTETVGGTVFTRFVGFVKSWPTSWPAVVATFSTVAPAATDAQARAERTTLRSMLEEEILLPSPTAYYTLGEAEGSTTAGDTSGGQATTLTSAGTGTAFTMGTGTGPVDGLTATQFFDGTYLSDQDTGAMTLGTSSAMMVVWASTTSSVARIAQIGGWSIAQNGSGVSAATVQTGSGTGFGVDSFTSYIDGHTHVAFIVGAGATATFIVDGVTIGSDATTAVEVFAETRVAKGVIGTVSHVAFWPTLTTAQAVDISALALGTLTEAGTARITRLAGYADVPVGTLDTSLTTVGAQVTTDVGAFAAIQDVADAEGGLVFINGSGNLTFHNRSRPSVKTAPDLTLDKQWVTPDVQPVLDDQQLINYFQATAAATGGTQLARNLTSEAAHGRYPDSKTYLVLTDQEALDRGNWIIGKLATPVPRYGTLTINLYGMTASQASTVLAALDLNCWLRVTSMASQTPGGTTADVVVEGWQEQVTAESWTITCNVVDHSLFVAGIYDNATLGVYNTSVYAY